MAFDAGSRVDPPVDLMLAQVIATVRQIPLGRIRELAAWLYISLASVAVGAEGLCMTGGTDHPLVLSIEAMFVEEARRLVVQQFPVVGVALATVRQFSNFFRMHSGFAGRTACAGYTGVCMECANE